MKRQVTAPTVSIDRKDESEGATLVRTRPAPRQPAPPPRPARPAADAGEAALVLTSVSTWTHRLVLDGELTYTTASTLEVEIEGLCEQGVTDITLDLRPLKRVDPVGVAVVAFRAGLCAKRGYGFALIRGSREIQRAFELAGVAEALPFQDDELADGRLSAGTLERTDGIAAGAPLPSAGG